MTLLPDEADLKKARYRLLRLLGYRERSRLEAEVYLRQKGFDSTVITALLGEMEQLHYIDDHRFADEFIQSCLRRGLGPLRARCGLTAKGISRDLVEERITRYYSPEKERALAITVLAKRVSSEDDFTERSWIRRQVSFMQQRGFHDQVILSILRERCSCFDD